MKTAIFATLLAGVAAFAPVSQKASTSTALNMAFEGELGAQAPLGVSRFPVVDGKDQGVHPLLTPPSLSSFGHTTVVLGSPKIGCRR
jgi:hypothetical protein